METKYPPLKTKRFSTGIEDIDAQHQQLYDTVEIFNCNENSIETLWNILMDLEKYTAIHFKTEEKYMEKFDYPLTETHTKEHEFFTQKFMKLKKEFTDEGFSKSFINDFHNFLTSWLSNHYAGSDIQLADFLNERLSAIANDDN